MWGPGRCASRHTTRPAGARTGRERRHERTPAGDWAPAARNDMRVLASRSSRGRAHQRRFGQRAVCGVTLRHVPTAARASPHHADIIAIRNQVHCRGSLSLIARHRLQDSDQNAPIATVTRRRTASIDSATPRSAPRRSAQPAPPVLPAPPGCARPRLHTAGWRQAPHGTGHRGSHPSARRGHARREDSTIRRRRDRRIPASGRFGEQFESPTGTVTLAGRCRLPHLP